MTEQTATLPLYPFPTPHSMDDDPELARLRAEQPVAKVRIASGHEVWIATRHQDVKLTYATTERLPHPIR